MKEPKVGIGVIILKGDKVLMQKRKSDHGQGTWSFPGGHLEFNEFFEKAAIRETREECGLEISQPEFVYATNDLHLDEDKHYITVYMKTEGFKGEPKVLEPDKAERWQWIKWGDFPKPLFLPIINLLKSGFNPFKND